MKGFDARCLGCDTVHIIWVPWTSKMEHEEGDEIGWQCFNCGYEDHRLESALNGLDHHPMWGTREEVGTPEEARAKARKQRVGSE